MTDARFLGRHYVYRTYTSVAAGEHRLLEAEIEIDPPSFLRRTSACRWRTLNLHPTLTATGRATVDRGFCTVRLRAQSGLHDITFTYMFEDDGSDVLEQAKLGILAGRTSTTLSPYFSEVLLSRRRLVDIDAVAVLGPASTHFVRLADAKERLAALAAKLRGET